MRSKLFFSAALILSHSLLLAAEPATNSRPSTLVHDWERIDYPWRIPNVKNSPMFSVAIPDFLDHSADISRGLRLDIMNIAQGFPFFKTNAIVARLYRTNGEIVAPTAEGKKLLNAPVAISTASIPGVEPNPQVLTYFPWGANTLEEAWIEVAIGSERYWLEIPYGFDRDPKDPLSPPNSGGPPRFCSAMKSLDQHDHVVPWQDVHYRLGQTDDGRELTLIQSNPFDAKSDVDLYRSDKSSDLYSPHTTLCLLEADGTITDGRCVNLHLDDNHLRRTDTFDLILRGNDDSRCWGQIEVKIDDKAYRAVVPSSLYKYVHGHARRPASIAFESTLSVGMTKREADMALNLYYCTNSPVSGASRQYRYTFLPDEGAVTLQFDDSNQLVSWK